MNIRSLIHKHYVSIFFFIILLVLIVSLITGQNSIRAETAVPESPAKSIDMPSLMSSMNMYALSPPEPVPDFPLMSLDGSKIQLGELRGNVVLLSFWATW